MNNEIGLWYCMFHSCPVFRTSQNMMVKKHTVCKTQPGILWKERKPFSSSTALFITTFSTSLLPQTCSSHLYHLPLSPPLALTDHLVWSGKDGIGKPAHPGLTQCPNQLQWPCREIIPLLTFPLCSWKKTDRVKGLSNNRVLLWVTIWK